MKRAAVVFAIVLSAAVLAGCAVVPLGWHGGAGYSYRTHSRGYAPYGDRPYYGNPRWGRPYGYR